MSGDNVARVLAKLVAEITDEAMQSVANNIFESSVYLGEGVQRDTLRIIEAALRDIDFDYIVDSYLG